MPRTFARSARLLALLLLTLTSLAAQDIKTLEPGAAAPDFKLKGTDGKTYKLNSFKKAKLLCVVFTCNHCPTAQAYEQRIIEYSKQYKAQGLQVVAIMPNSPEAVRLDELGYTDLNDSYAEMKIRAAELHLPFPYLYDGDTQVTATAYGAVATPHFFLFDEKRTLRYVGRFDDTEKPSAKPNTHDLKDATEALLAGQAVTNAKTKTFGCSLKWKVKHKLVVSEAEEWAKEPVNLLPLDSTALAALLRNDAGKLRVINLWATWCGPCVREFPDFMEIHHMYRRRDFEFVSITTDKMESKAKALQFLQSQHASNTNYILDGINIYKVIEMVNPAWQGALPYTLIIEPGGKKVYGKQGAIEPLELKRKIVEHPLVGRYF